MDETAKELTEIVLKVFQSRKGFGWWWEEIGSYRSEIKRELRAKIKKQLKFEAALKTTNERHGGALKKLADQ